MRFARWVTKPTNTHSDYVVLIAFPRQQWLRERASILRYSALRGLFLTDYKYPFSDLKILFPKKERQKEESKK
jgi:hypothetical protein